MKGSKVIRALVDAYNETGGQYDFPVLLFPKEKLTEMMKAIPEASSYRVADKS